MQLSKTFGPRQHDIMLQILDRKHKDIPNSLCFAVTLHHRHEASGLKPVKSKTLRDEKIAASKHGRWDKAWE